MGSWALFWLYIGGGCLVSVAGALIVRRVAPHEVMLEHREVAGFVYAVVGCIYAVILGFCVVATWENFNEAHHIADREASTIMDLHGLAEGLPSSQRDLLQKNLRNYCQMVIQKEWPMMARGEIPLHRSEEVKSFWRQIVTFEPQGQREQAIHGRLLDELNDFCDARRTRLLDIHLGLADPMWVCLFGGAIIVIGFSYLFGLKGVCIHVLITSLLVLSIALSLFAIATLDRPFSGGSRVPPESFEIVLSHMKESTFPVP